MDLEPIGRDLARELDALDAAREAAYRTARELIRAASSAIRAVHRGEDPSPALDEARRLAASLRSATASAPDIWAAGYVRDALGELAEAELLVAYLSGRALPAADRIGVPATAYVLGFGDLVGEVRRMALDRLREGDVDAAEGHLAAMEALTDTLIRLDYPDGLVPVRRKQDTARALVEKTRGEVAVARSNKRTQEKVDAVRGLLDRLEREETPKKAGKRASSELDIDSVW